MTEARKQVAMDRVEDIFRDYATKHGLFLVKDTSAAAEEVAEQWVTQLYDVCQKDYPEDLKPNYKGTPLDKNFNPETAASPNTLLFEALKESFVVSASEESIEKAALNLNTLFSDVCRKYDLLGESCSLIISPELFNNSLQVIDRIKQVDCNGEDSRFWLYLRYDLVESPDDSPILLKSNDLDVIALEAGKWLDNANEAARRMDMIWDAHSLVEYSKISGKADGDFLECYCDCMADPDYDGGHYDHDAVCKQSLMYAIQRNQLDTKETLALVQKYSPIYALKGKEGSSYALDMVHAAQDAAGIGAQGHKRQPKKERGFSR